MNTTQALPLPSRYLVGFTGHRSGFDEEMIRPVLEQALLELQRQAAQRSARMEICTSIAEGGDTLCVEVARRLTIEVPIHIILPLPEAEFMKDFSSPDAWQRSQFQLSICRERPDFDSVQVVPGNTKRPECYAAAGRRMLDLVEVLVALWDGQPSRGPGGTAEIMACARARGIPLIVINAHSAQRIESSELAQNFPI